MTKINQFFISLVRKTGLMPFFNFLMNLRYRLTESVYKIKGRNHLEVIYNDKFYNHDNQNTVLQNTPQLLAQYLIENYQPQSVVDIGCGTGVYLQALAQAGVKTFGIDGSPAALKNFRLGPDQFRLADVTKPLNLNQKYSVALCFEVAEHIPTKDSSQLVRNLTGLADLIFFSAAPPGQGGIGHINEQDQKFWLELFKQAGFSYQSTPTESLKKFLHNNHGIFWLSNNMMIFKKAE